VRRKVAVVTGTRAEYGLLRWVMDGIRLNPALELQVIVTGMHLSPEFGLTYKEIEGDGFHIDRRVEMLLSSDTPVGIAKSIGVGVIGFADALQDLRPDLLLVLGDRFEILAAATAALVARIPIVHLHGGELSEGAFDDAIRHSLTKMSHWHFVATEDYRRRVIQLGEDPQRVFHVGALGIDSIRTLALLDRDALEAELGFALGTKSLLVTFHPVTLDNAPASQPMAELLATLDRLEDTRIIFTMPNADTGGRALFGMIEDFVAVHPNARAYTSLGQLRYLSCMRHVDAVVGNSSSGLIEAPSLRVPSVNIGDRQRGRVRAASVVDCGPDRASIRAAIDRVYSPVFRAQLSNIRNPYGEGGASRRIVEQLAVSPLDGELKKAFFDLPGVPLSTTVPS
jgi:GDP/UDP-N,N'-diacetylbacillosamine 2-epimerase (hydrolysing)